MSVHCVMNGKHININVIYFEFCKKNLFGGYPCFAVHLKSCVCVCVCMGMCAHACARMCVYVCVIKDCNKNNYLKIKKMKTQVSHSFTHFI